jgi:hypothetical protein
MRRTQCCCKVGSAFERSGADRGLASVTDRTQTGIGETRAVSMIIRMLRRTSCNCRRSVHRGRRREEPRQKPKLYARSAGRASVIRVEARTAAMLRKWARAQAEIGP